MISVSALQEELVHKGYEQQLHEGEGATSEFHLTEEGNMKFGIWEVTPGVFDSEWEDWESFTIIDGEGTLTDGNGVAHELRPGALIVIPPHSTGQWNITKTLRKTFVYPAGSVGR